MSDAGVHLGFLRKLIWSDILLLATILLGCGLAVFLTRRIVRLAAEKPVRSAGCSSCAWRRSSGC